MSVETIDDLLNVLRGERGTSPRLIWYGPDSERVELSGRVLDNWVAKTSNLLVDELDAEAGTTVLLDLPPHWRSLSWALAGWQIGAQLRIPAASYGAGGAKGQNSGDHSGSGHGGHSASASASDVIVTTDPSRWAEIAAPPQFLVAVALPALQMNWNGPLPAGALDYAGEVRSHADEYLGLPRPAETALALSSNDMSVTYAQLFDTDAAGAGHTITAAEKLAPEHGQTVLITADTALNDVLRLALRTWADDGAVVLVHSDVPVTQSLLTGERITRRYGAAPGR